MIKVVSSEKIPIKMWLDDIEEDTLKQAKNLANLPFAFKHIAIMPDSHLGYGMPIGGVLTTRGVVIPNAVGVDIGCGICTIKTSLTEINTNTLKTIMNKIRQVIPVGFNKHKQFQDFDLIPSQSDSNWVRDSQNNSSGICNKESGNAQLSLGTLGGGNHFIEIQQDSDTHIWIMIHSGSRNLGFKVANHYNNLAKEINRKWNSSVPKEWDLAFLPVDSEEGQNYIKEMNYCVEYAYTNRKLMMDRIGNILLETFPNNSRYRLLGMPDTMINIAHNYAALENHYGENVWVHRKGATLARKNTVGIIPGSQGTASYIVKGKGNKESFMSCSHGAGRTMSRTKAKNILNLEEEKKKLDDQGIIHSIRNQKDLDEASSAYKDIDTVMGNQEDLVEILVRLKPLAVIKG